MRGERMQWQRRNSNLHFYLNLSIKIHLIELNARAQHLNQWRIVVIIIIA